MPEYLAPGVYVEEISTGPKPIEGVSTSIAGFVGITERGPEDIRYITSWIQFQRWYGGHLPVEKTFMVHVVQGFFDNGGQRCYIARIVGNQDNAAAASSAPLGSRNTIFAVGRGVWGNRIRVRIDRATQAKNNVAKASNWVRVQVVYFVNSPENFVDPFDPAKLQDPDRREPDAVEDYDDLSLVPGSANFLVTIINQASKLIRIESSSPPKAPEGIVTSPEFIQLAGGAESETPVKDDYDGDLKPIINSPDLILGQGRGLAAMSAVSDVSLLMIPDQVKDSNLTKSLVRQCETMKDRFGVLSADRDFSSEANPVRPSEDTHYAAQYYPWIWVYGTYERDDVLIPPTGHVAGIIARTDLEQGVHKPPANAIVLSAKDLHRPVTFGDSARLNPVGINCIRDFRPDGRGIRLWGARTMTSDPEWKYVNVRRLFLFVEKSIDRGTQWVVFEPNSEPTWARVVRTVTSFLINVWRSGALMGTTPDQAFFVKCDRTTMTQDDIDNGRLLCYIGIAPVKPAEFVIFRIGQKTSEAQS